jgi:hypothetical protein
MAFLTRRVFLAVMAVFAPAAGLRVRASQPAATVTLDEFVALSERLLGRSKLDREIAQVYLRALVADADTAVHLATLAASNGNPTPEQTVVARTIIEWWYTGVATHTGALTWAALGMPAPGTCAGPFGAWSRPPEGVA